MKYRGFIVDRGLSAIDGQPYVAIMTLKSLNAKTGDMAQVFIIRPDMHPLEAINSGADVTICGNCPHRRHYDDSLGKFVRSCYVDVGKSVGAVYRAFLNGSYVDLTQDPPQDAVKWLQSHLGKRRIRWGAYGDPAIINPEVVVSFNGMAQGHTGYTHQWRQEFASSFIGVFMASCDSFQDYLDASDAGWRTFAVVPKGSQAYSGKLCPATAENSQAQCITCKLCDGAKTDIHVEAHGLGAKFVTA